MNLYQRDLIIIQNFFASRTRQRSVNDFHEIFAAFHPRKIVVYPSQDPKGLSTSIAHVTFANENDAIKAFDELQNKVVYNNETLLLTLTSQDHAPIDCLPNECLLEILSRLPVQDKLMIEEVCTKWNGIASKCWTNEKKFYVTQVDSRMKKKTFSEYMERCGPYCKDIEISLNIDHQILSTLENCKNLNSIRVTIANRSVKGDAFYHLLRLTNELTITRAMIDIQWYSLFPFPFDAFLQSLSEKTTEIHYIQYVHFGARDRYRFLDNLNFSKFKNLRALSLQFFDLSEHSSVGFEQLENLVCLVLRNSLINLDLIKKIKNFRKLEHLSIPGTEITDDILDDILSNNENLEFLNISESPNIADRSLVSLSQHENLRVLKMTNMHNVTFQNFSGFKNLRCLCCNDCSKITPDGMKRVLEKSPNLQVISAYGVAAMRSSIFDIKSIVRKTVSGKTLIPTQTNTSLCIWLENDSDPLKPAAHLRFSSNYFYDAWFNKTVTWYNHDEIRQFH